MGEISDAQAVVLLRLEKIISSAALGAIRGIPRKGLDGADYFERAVAPACIDIAAAHAVGLKITKEKFMELAEDLFDENVESFGRMLAAKAVRA